MVFAHVTIHVQDFERSLRFYTEEMGLPVAARFEGRPGVQIAMLGDMTKLEIVGDGKGPVDYPEVSIGFEMKDAGNVAKRLDPDFKGPISPNPRVTFYFIRDPDGYQVQLLEAGHRVGERSRMGATAQATRRRSCR